MIMWVLVYVLVGLALVGCGNDRKASEQRYVLSIGLEFVGKGKAATDGVVRFMDVDTVTAASPLVAYSKGVQRYAAMLMHIQQFPDSIRSLKGLMVKDDQGNDIRQEIPQAQRDSVIMSFIQFARRSNIPYYERVKDFELNMMTVR